MPDRPRPSGDLPGQITVAAVVAVIACCALPLLVAAGLFTFAGVALRSLAPISAGGALAAWLVLHAIRNARRRQPLATTPSGATRPSGGAE